MKKSQNCQRSAGSRPNSVRGLDKLACDDRGRNRDIGIYDDFQGPYEHDNEPHNKGILKHIPPKSAVLQVITDQFLQSHCQNISNFDTQIVQQTKTRDIALGIVDAATPIINDVNNLNAQTAALRSHITALMPSLQDLKVHLNDLHVQVDDIAEAFSTITELKHFDLSTDRYVQILVGLATSTVKIDACCLNPAEWLIGQVAQIPIPPRTGSTLQFGRDNASSGQTTVGDAAAWVRGAKLQR
ncbi:hypothetical protein VTN00DRAFT_9571 [Thermoascus crustaceus]|uniref:uncharacterized protein n=1 Tax=Thermoascus crustaceus TaxID=5088 RepID=UPI0037420674